MSQEIKIGLHAETHGAEKGVEKVEKATEGLADALKSVDAASSKAEASIEGVGAAADGVADSVKKIDAAAAGAEKSIDRLAAKAKRLKDVQDILSRELKSKVTPADAEKFAENFARIRNGRSLGSGRLRDFDSFEDWYRGHGHGFKRPQDAAAHRLRTFARGMQGTDWAAGQAPPAGAPLGGGGPGLPRGAWRGPPPGGNQFPGLPGASSLGGAALRFGGIALGAAGIASSVSGLVSMIMSGVEMATQEAGSVDLIKRRMGAFGGRYGDIRDSPRSAAAGLQISYADSARYGVEYQAADGRSGDVSAGLRTAYGVSRGLGLDPGEGSQFFGTMSRLGVARDDAGQRRFAVLIADAIERGGFTAKADDVLHSIAEFATSTARQSLSSPNVGAYLSSLTGMTASGYPGLDPNGAAGILGRANAAMMQGGAMGEASQNVSYAALARGYSPVVAQTLWEGGLFATPDSIFGKGTISGDYYRQHGIDTPTGSQTNFDAVMSMLQRQYGGGNKPEFFENAVRNQFGLGSNAQAEALIDMHNNPIQLSSAQDLLKRSGVDVEHMSNLSGLSEVIKLTGAKTMDDLRTPVEETLDRPDVTDREKLDIQARYRNGDMEGARGALAKIYGDRGYAPTDNTKLQASLTDMKDALINVGDKLFDPLDAIREAVVAMAGRFMPEEWRKAQQAKEDSKKDFAAITHDASPADAQVQVERRDRIDALYAQAKKDAGGGPFDINKIAPQPEHHWFDGFEHLQHGYSGGLHASGFDMLQDDHAYAVQLYNRDFGTNIPTYMTKLGDAHGIRLNNPGNLRSWGDTPTENGFAKFGSPIEGISAMMGNLHAFRDKHHLDTIEGIASRWAPENDGNDPAAWAKGVAARSGLGLRDKLDENDPNVMRRLLPAITWQEDGQNPYSDDTFDVGINSRLMQEGITRPGTPMPAGAPAAASAPAGAAGPIQVHGSADIRILDPFGREVGRAAPSLSQMSRGPTPGGQLNFSGAGGGYFRGG